jgi:hypothetical protein
MAASKFNCYQLRDWCYRKFGREKVLAAIAEDNDGD